ncbi:DUF1294 domain-containing protein [Rheinheimera salexigens]|uniref:CSD domain-containing protein n=1 Tax=Rheinheimera salexigens TaxID=1628148 RepID=A0A1E7Q3U6_9GAMM|nr:cold shock and DUF1294 domain-containing protein [Rheinheimera salexigens]OEY68790.1 hypothetical protein BI198_03835 [Rheinheimera salexigens]
MRVKGKIQQWDDAKGFGFIQPTSTSDKVTAERVFLHASALQNRQRRPVVGEVVTYLVIKDDKGRNQAQNVTFAGEQLSAKPIAKAKASSNWPSMFVAIFFIGLVLVSWLLNLSWYVLIGYAVISVLTFASYAWDKYKSKQEQWRTPESTLQIFALIGGWPGGLLAQNWLRHKSRKASFLWLFWCMVLLNIVALVWLYRLGILQRGFF